MKQYKSHKIVEAAQILLIDAVNSVPKDGGVSEIVAYEFHHAGGVVSCSPDIFSRGVAGVGDYIVSYANEKGDNAYFSWSPKAVFEEGYKLHDPQGDEQALFSTQLAQVRLTCIQVAAAKVSMDQPSALLYMADGLYKFVRGDKIEFEIKDDGEQQPTSAPEIGALQDKLTGVQDAVNQTLAILEVAAATTEAIKAAGPEGMKNGGDIDALTKAIFGAYQTLGDLTTYLRG